MNVFGDVLEVVYVMVVYFWVVFRKVGYLLILIYMFNIRVVFVGKIILFCLELMGVVINVWFGIDINDIIDCIISCIVCGINNFLILYWFRGLVLW